MKKLTFLILILLCSVISSLAHQNFSLENICKTVDCELCGLKSETSPDIGLKCNLCSNILLDKTGTELTEYALFENETEDVEVLKNSVCVEVMSFSNPNIITITYQRNLLLAPGVALGLGFGGGHAEAQFLPKLEASLVFGKTHFFVQPSVAVLRGYIFTTLNMKYQTTSGFFVKAGVVIRGESRFSAGIGISF